MHLKTLLYLVLVCATAGLYSCTQDDPPQPALNRLPVVITGSIGAITPVSASAGGTVTDTGSTAVTSRGICVKSSAGASLADRVITSGNGEGTFSVIIDSLLPNSTYYFKAFASNNIGTAYGNEIVLTTAAPNTIFWDNMVFGRFSYGGTNNPYFSTIDPTVTGTLNEASAQAISDKIDLVYIYNTGYDQPGFMDPVTISQHWYWDDYYTPWLSNAYSTKFYMTRLTRAEYDSAKSDGLKLSGYFNNSAKVYLAPHTVFPPGSCIGGRSFCVGAADCNVNSIKLLMGKVYGFVSNNKKGLIYIRTDQSAGWPVPLLNFNTRVDIVKEK